MEFLTRFRAFAHLLCGGLVFCTGCMHTGEQQYHISVDSTSTQTGIQDMYDYGRIVEGIWFIETSTGSMYACGLKDYHTLALRNLDMPADTANIFLADSVHSFTAKDGQLYCVSDNRHKITILDFAKGSMREPGIDSVLFEPVFNDTVFNASSLHGPMVAGGHNELLIRYRMGHSDNVNMLDRFVYKYIHGTPVKAESIIPQPAELLNEYQFLHQAIGTFNAKGDKLFYMFESIPKLYRYDMLRRQVDSVLIPEFRTRKYDADKQGDFTYLRNYIDDNDANRRLLYDAGLLYLVKRNAAARPSNYTIFCFDTSLRLLAHIDVRYKLNTEIVFIKDHKLYIYAHKSNTKFYTFSLGQ